MGALGRGGGRSRAADERVVSEGARRRDGPEGGPGAGGRSPEGSTERRGKEGGAALGIPRPARRSCGGGPGPARGGQRPVERGRQGSGASPLPSPSLPGSPEIEATVTGVGGGGGPTRGTAAGSLCLRTVRQLPRGPARRLPFQMPSGVRRPFPSPWFFSRDRLLEACRLPSRRHDVNKPSPVRAAVTRWHPGTFRMPACWSASRPTKHASFVPCECHLCLSSPPFSPQLCSLFHVC